MRYIESPSHDAYFNMALEEVVLDGLAVRDDFFMLWQNKNAVVVGKYQNTAQEINAQFVKDTGVQVVRRLSGGGAMYQDLGNLNFTFVVENRADDKKRLDFSAFLNPVVAALQSLGVPAQCSGRNDILVDGKKISGNAQCRRAGRTLHHGTLLYQSNLENVARALNPGMDKLASKAVQSVRSRVTNAAEQLANPPSTAQFKALLLQALFAETAAQPYALTAQEQAHVQTLQAEKYATWAWVYGRSPAYDLQRERRYPFGKITVGMRVENGRIQALDFTGDFFSARDPQELAEILQGCELRTDALRQTLDGVEIDAFIHGLDAGALRALLTGTF